MVVGGRLIAQISECRILFVRSQESVGKRRAGSRVRVLRQEAGAGLTPSQLSALAVIANHGPLTLGALADHERVAPPSITKVVTKLEAQSLVVRTPDPADRRIAWVAVSPEGASLLAESRRRKTAWLTARIRELSPDQQRRLAGALDVLDDLTAQGREGR